MSLFFGILLVTQWPAHVGQHIHHPGTVSIAAPPVLNFTALILSFNTLGPWHKKNGRVKRYDYKIRATFSLWPNSVTWCKEPDLYLRHAWFKSQLRGWNFTVTAFWNTSQTQLKITPTSNSTLDNFQSWYSAVKSSTKYWFNTESQRHLGRKMSDITRSRTSHNRKHKRISRSWQTSP